MNKEYIIKFYHDDGTIEEKIFFLKPSATVKATALITKYFNINDNNDLLSCLEKLTSNESILNEVMNSVVRTNSTDAIDWSIADTKQMVGALMSFFISYVNQMNTSIDSQKVTD